MVLRMMDYTFKIVVVGDGGVGKTTLLRRYIEGKFQERMIMTIGVDLFVKNIRINGDVIALQLWDIGGQRQFESLLHCYTEGCHALIFAFDFTSHKTLERINEYIFILKAKYDVPMMIIGTKYDLIEDGTYKISSEMREQYESLMEYYGITEFLPTSSKTGLNVDAVFERIGNKSLECIKK